MTQKAAEKGHFQPLLLLLVFLFPLGPDLGTVAYGGLSSVADYRGTHELGVFHELRFDVGVIGEVLYIELLVGARCR